MNGCVETHNKSMLHQPLRGQDGFSARSSLQTAANARR